ncbi:MAG: class I SAM-dependent methyltransferase [Planctomycetota bacterium]|nr:class I SAM-dependent methyltransferase [Planctomycetota bacterium]
MSESASHTPTHAPAGEIAPNYAYWREHGASWEGEYRARKTSQVLYHIQEMMLASYMLRTAERNAGALRVLEFGCGPGRHLRNLRALPGVEPHGYDQSESMTRGALAWCTPDWLEAHVRVGDPTGRLPYDDDSFDVVYSTEVLVHVRPDDLAGILRELLRVARHQVLHLEPTPGIVVGSDIHDGCWNHDLVRAYRALGHECEVLPRGYEVHTPFRVMLGGAAPYTWPREILDMCLRMERDMNAGLRAAAQQATEAAVAGEARVRDVEQRLGAAADEARARAGILSGELEAARNALAAESAARAQAAGDLARALEKSLALELLLDERQTLLDNERAALAEARASLDEVRAAHAAALAAAERLDAERLAAIDGLSRAREQAARDAGLHATIVASLRHDLRSAGERLAALRDERAKAADATRALHMIVSTATARLRRSVEG